MATSPVFTETENEQQKQLLLQLNNEGLIYFDIDRENWVTQEELLNSSNIYDKIERLEKYINKTDSEANNSTSNESDDNALKADWIDDLINAEPKSYTENENDGSSFPVYPDWIKNTLPKTLEILKKNRPVPVLPDASPDFQQACLVAMDFDYNSFDQKTKDYLAQNILQCQVGVNWIDPQIYTQFACEFFDIEVDIIYQSGHYFMKEIRTYSETNCKKYATDKFNGHEIFLKLLNKEQLRVTQKDLKTGKTKLDSTETVNLQTKAKQIKQGFDEWIWQDLDRTVKLTQKYNRIFNSIHVAYSSGDHLEFPGLNPECQLKKEQKDAVWRIIKSQTTGLFAKVGFGKTWVMVCAAMLLKQMKLAHRPMIIVLSSTLPQFVATAQHLYPNAKILYRNEEEFEQSKLTQRAILTHQITTQDWDLIILTHEQFLAIPISPASQEKFIKEELAKLEEILAKTRNSGSAWESKNIIRYLQRQQNQLQKSLEQAYSSYAINSSLMPCWETLEIDALFVDESQQFKNLWFATNMGNIAGIANRNSYRSFNLYHKILHLHQHNRRIIFSTGTPLSNSIAEMFTLMRYLCPQLLKQMQIEEFDNWAAQFGEIVEQPEVDITGQYRMKTRFLRFKNLPELMAIFNTFAIVYTDQNIQSFQDKPLPHYATITIPQTQQQQDYMKQLAERATRIQDVKIDNLAKISQEARLCSLDTGLLNLPDLDPNSKLHTLIKNIYLAWKLLRPCRGVQVVFCDLVNYAYEYISQALTYLGIPQYEIRAVQAAKNREELYCLAQKGTVSIVLASTDVAGAGVNIQNRLAVLHHANAPWRPSDVIQREGRIIRQGNSFKKVVILRYVNRSQTQQLSYDTFMWQTLENKAIFIEQILTTNQGFIPRTIEDIYTQKTLSYAEIKAIASGNPIFLEKTQLEHRLKQIQIEYSNWRRNQMSLRHEKTRAQSEIPFCQKRLEQLETINFDQPNGQLLGTPFSSWEQFAQILSEKNSVFESETGGHLWNLIPIATKIEWKNENGKFSYKTQFLINKQCIRCRKPDSLKKEVEALVNGFKESLLKRLHNAQEILRFTEENTFSKKAEMSEIEQRLAQIEEIISKEALALSAQHINLDQDNNQTSENNDEQEPEELQQNAVTAKVSWKLCLTLQKEADEILLSDSLPENYQWLNELKNTIQQSFPNVSATRQTITTENLATPVDIAYETEPDGQLSLLATFSL